MNDLVGCARLAEARTQVVLHGEAPAPRELGRETACQVLLPACAEDRVTVARLSQLELDDPIEHRSAVGGARRVAAATSERDAPENTRREKKESL